ncbi:hypothetical protein [Arthrobacter sp. ISL-30]|nr:hypothetical protein [Arthrobacter sp. ISL-30]
MKQYNVGSAARLVLINVASLLGFRPAPYLTVYGPECLRRVESVRPELH